MVFVHENRHIYVYNNNIHVLFPVSKYSRVNAKDKMFRLKYATLVHFHKSL